MYVKTVYAVVDLYGAVTAVSLCGPAIDLSQSGTATISHSVTSVLTPTDNVNCEPADTCELTAEVCYCFVNIINCRLITRIVVALD